MPIIFNPPPRPLPTNGPDHLDVENLGKYPGHSFHKHQDHNGCYHYGGAFYDERGNRLQMDPKALERAGIKVDETLLNVLRNHYKHVKPTTRACGGCGCDTLPVQAKFCHQCGTEQLVQMVDPNDAILGLLSSLTPNDPFATLRMPGDLPARETDEQLMPKANEISQYAREEKLPMSAIGVPGEQARPTAPAGGLKAVGTVAYEGRRS